MHTVTHTYMCMHVCALHACIHVHMYTFVCVCVSIYVTRSHQTSLNSQIPNAATARNSSGGQFGFFCWVF